MCNTIEGAFTFFESYDINIDTIEVNENESVPFKEYKALNENMLNHYEQVDRPMVGRNEEI